MPSSSVIQLSTYFPDRAPTWTEVLIGVLVGINFGFDVLSPETMSWPAVVAGFLVFSVALGPGGNSPFGRRVGQWFRDIGATGRLAVIGSFALSAIVMSRFNAVPYALIADAASGGLFACFLYLIAYLVLAKEVHGWKANQANGD